MSLSKEQLSKDGLAPETSDDGLSENQIFEILSNQRRRYVFHYLKGADREVYLRELSEQVAAWENEKDKDQLTSKELKRVKTALHQHHLPKMDDEDFLEYDQRREAATISEPAAQLDIYLDVVSSGDVPWSRYYLGLSVLGGLLFSGVEFGAPLLGSAGYPPVVIFFVTTFFVSALAHVYFNSRSRLGTSGDPPEVLQT